MEVGEALACRGRMSTLLHLVEPDDGGRGEHRESTYEATHPPWPDERAMTDGCDSALQRETVVE